MMRDMVKTAYELEKMMGIHAPIERAYPKVKPLAQALIAAAATQGASAEEFKMAVSMVMDQIQKEASGILLSELKRDT